MDPEAWLRRFDPCYLTGDDSGVWVTDRFRMHRLPTEVRAFADSVCGPVGWPSLLTWGAPGSPPECTPFPGFPIEEVLGRARRARRLDLHGVDAREGHTILRTGDLQLIRLRTAFVQQAVDDGVRSWRGTGPSSTVVGVDAAGDALAVVMPLTSSSDHPSRRSRRRS